MTTLVRAGHVLTMGAAGDLRDGGRHTTLDLAEVTNAARDVARRLEAAGGIPLAAQIRRQ